MIDWVTVGWVFAELLVFAGGFFFGVGYEAKRRDLRDSQGVLK